VEALLRLALHAEAEGLDLLLEQASAHIELVGAAAMLPLVAVLLQAAARAPRADRRLCFLVHPSRARVLVHSTDSLTPMQVRAMRVVCERALVQASLPFIACMW
jgi:hypothetical protein